MSGENRKSGKVELKDYFNVRFLKTIFQNCDKKVLTPFKQEFYCHKFRLVQALAHKRGKEVMN